MIKDPLIAILLCLLLGLAVALLFIYNWAKPFYDTFMTVISVAGFSIGIWQIFRK